MEDMKETKESSFNPEDYSLKEILKPRHTALVVVDMQNDYLHPDGFFANFLKADISNMQSTIPHIEGLIDAAHDSNIPVIFTKGHDDVKFRKGPDMRRAVKWGEKDGDGSVNSESGTWGAEFHEDIQPQEGDIVVEKHKWSAFDGKDNEYRSLQEILESKGIHTLVITGVVAQTCVETTIRDAYSRDYFVVIPRNSVGSDNKGQLKERMSYWEAGFVGDVLDEGEIKDLWSSAGDVTHAKEHAAESKAIV
jgi:ureidoacrylate peracid hydrolase